MLRSALDHLVVTAGSRESGVAYLADLLGVTPREGGEHPRMGTHNALLRLGEAAYLEVIAANPHAPAPSRPRWFGLDREGADGQPRLATWVLRTNDIHAAIDRSSVSLGPIEAMTRGSLSWLIAVPPDGDLLLGGAAPALIQWSGAHPAATLPDSGCWLEELTIRHEQIDWLEAFLRDIGFDGAVVLKRPTASHQAGLSARIRKPTGVVILGER